MNQFIDAENFQHFAKVLLDTTLDGVWVIDAEDRTIYVNPRMADMLGYSPDDLIGKPLVDFMSDQHKAGRSEQRARRESGISEQYECALVRKDGSLLWTLVSTNPIFDDNESYSGAFAILRDTTAKKAIEKALQKSEERYKHVFEQIFDGIIITSPDGTITDANPSACAALGYEREELLGKSSDIIVATTQHERLKEFRHEILTTDIHLREWQMKRKDGSLFEIEASSRRVSDIGVMTVGRDITERKVAQARLDRFQEMLTQAEEMAKLGSWMLDLRSGEMIWSAQNYRIFGIPDGSDLAFKTPMWQTHPGDIEKVTQQWKDGIDVTGSMDYEHRLLLPDGTVRELAVRAKVEYSSAGQPTSVHGVTMDVTSWKRTEQELRDKESRLRLLNQISTGVTAGMSITDAICSTLTLISTAFLGTTSCFYISEANTLMKSLRSAKAGKVTRRNSFQFDLQDFPKLFSVLQAGHPFISENIFDTPELRAQCEHFASKDCVAIIAAPVREATRVIGILTLECAKERAWSPHEIATIQEIAEYLAIAIRESFAETARSLAVKEIQELNASLEKRVDTQTKVLRSTNARLEKQIREQERAEEIIKKRNNELGLLNLLSVGMQSSLLIPDRLTFIAQLLESQYEASAGYILLYDDYTHKLEPKEFWGLSNDAIDAISNDSIYLDSPAAVITQKRAHLSKSRLHANKAGNSITPLFLSDIQSTVTIPLITDEESLGALVLMHRKAIAVGDQELEFYETLGQQMGSALQKARLHARVTNSLISMRALSNRIVEVQEDERRNLARELHDEIGQLLTGIHLSIERVALKTESTNMTALSDARKLVSQVMERVRAMSLDLRPTMLDDLGLLPALEWFIKRYQSQTGVEVSFEKKELTRRLNGNVETAVYRIVQEALNNVSKHSTVKKAQVLVRAKGPELKVEITDPGVGFNVQDALKARNSSGLTGMQERAELLGGKLTIESLPSQGTVVSATLPCVSKEDRKQPL